METHYDTIIIGAGLSGLAAAIRLAHFGRKTAVIERHYRAGGLNSWYRRHGHLIDTGLHAMTNYAPKSDRRAPLNRMLRQLRIPYDALELKPQSQSSISFPQRSLTFTNCFEDFICQIRTHFPQQTDAFLKLVEAVKQFDAFSYDHDFLSSRKVLTESIGAGLLQEMLLCPLMYYGSAAEEDMDFRQFCLLFRSVFLEGFSRPRQGITAVLKLLEERLLQSDGHFILNNGVKAIDCDRGQVRGVRLDDGCEISCDTIISSAGRLETLALCRSSGASIQAQACRPGKMTFVESIFFLDCPPADLGFNSCITFFSRTDDFHFCQPGKLLDTRSGTICVPENFQQHDLADEKRMIRITSISDFDCWRMVSESAYPGAKRDIQANQLQGLEHFGPGIGDHVVASDTFTPLTLHRFTGHFGGAIYGTPDKAHDGRTPVEGLFLCGTDQGFLGIVGALLSGVSMANYHILGSSNNH